MLRWSKSVNVHVSKIDFAVHFLMIVEYVFEKKWKWMNEQTTRILIKQHISKSSPAWKQFYEFMM